jgi:hypothetical protein
MPFLLSLFLFFVFVFWNYGQDVTFRKETWYIFHVQKLFFIRSFFMQTIRTRKGVVITVAGNKISCSDGKVYTLNGFNLVGPGGFISRNVRSSDEAAGIVAGLYGGKLM